MRLNVNTFLASEQKALGEPHCKGNGLESVMASINGTPDTVRLPDTGFATPAYGASPLIADGDNTMSEGAWANS